MTQTILRLITGIMTPALGPRTVVLLLALSTSTAALDATLQNFKESPGLYYDCIGEVQLYNIEWRLLTYINRQEEDQNLEPTKKYAKLFIEICRKLEHRYGNNFNDCTKNVRLKCYNQPEQYHLPALRMSLKLTKRY